MLVHKLMNNKILSIIISFVFVSSMVAMIPSVTADGTRFDSQDYENGIPDFDPSTLLDSNSAYDQDFNAGDILSDNENLYNQVWDPWVSKAAIHAVATYDDGDYLALAGGYLYDNEIHLYRWNLLEDRYDLVWEIGDGIFQSDVTSLAFADTDYNDLVEIIAGGEDGYLYVFEQRHLYDPITNMENQFDLVWKSGRLGRIFDVHVFDSDGDFRQDIIVGTHDTMRWFEYDTHGNYPFTQDHYIEYREVFSYQLDSQITAIDHADTDSDGLPEVIVGSRSGEIVLMENNGTSIPINGQWFPILQDNSYVPIWSSGNSIRRPVSDMIGGDLDYDGHKELLIAVQGQGAYVLDTVEGEFGVYRLQREYESWEANPIEIYPLDVYTDIMLNSSSKDNSDDNELPASQADVYWTNGTVFPEPLNYTAHGNFIIYPYSSYSVMNQRGQPDGRYTTFNGFKNNNPNYANPWAIYDWGNDEAAAGNGIPTLWDLKIWVEDLTVAPENLNISLSNDNFNWYNVNSTYITTGDNGTHYFYLVEVDPTLANASLDAYRYMRFELLSNQILNVDVFETRGYDKPIYDALSVEMGTLTFKGDSSPTRVGFIGTIDGAVLGVIWNATEGMYQIAWDSWVDGRWKLETNLFDLALIKQQSRFPSWMYRDLSGAELNLNSMPDGGSYTSYTVDNFYNFHQDTIMDWIVTSSTGKLHVYEQYTQTTKPLYNAKLTDMLFGPGNGDDAPKRYDLTGEVSLQTFVNALHATRKYIAVDLLPIDVVFEGQNFSVAFDPYNSGFMLAVSYWDGTTGDLDLGGTGVPTTGEVGVSFWYLEYDFDVDTTDPGNNCDFSYGMPVCAFFRPFRDVLTAESPLFNTLLANSYMASLSSTEITGTMYGVMAESTWMPRLASADFIGNSQRDLVLSNGKIHLLESLFSVNQLEYQEGYDWIKANLDAIKVELELNAQSTKYSYFNLAVKGDYFKAINDDSKGRHWTNVRPVDWDGDGDFDLIAGFSRYNNVEFGFEKLTYGMTYWENQGTREEPIWVERIHAITNTDPDAGFRSQLYTDPVLVYDNYDSAKIAQNPDLGYSWLNRVDKPSRLLMFQPTTNVSIFSGKIVPFFAEYDQPVSLMAATYPNVVRLDINLKYVNQPGNTEINYGFHIFETWDNSEELNGWTLALSTADLDEDGDNEIIVGDFNNNVYVFEHLSNNSYGRAYRTFDVNRTIETDLSPYYHENFGGIDGTFSRTIFDHIEKLIAGFDLNQNNRQEFIGTTENVLFVWEATSSPTGRVRDDTYQLIAMVDLLEYPALMDLDQDDLKISALTWADDFTNDGRRELIIGVNAALLILEVEVAPTPGYLEMGEFETEEVFFADSYNLAGLYDLPGNYFVNPYHQIKALLVEDLDNDGRLDLVVAGTDRSTARPIYDGFIVIYEWYGSGIRLMEDDGIFAETTEFTPINDLEVDDADFDNKKELLIGHEQGVDIYEFVAENTPEYRETITSNPAYHLPDRNYHDVNVGYGFLGPSKDVIRDPSTGNLYMVYTRGNPAVMVWSTSTDNGQTWNDLGDLTYNPVNDLFDLSLDFLLGGTFQGVDDPSLVYNNGVLWLGFVEKYHQGGFTYFIMYVVQAPNYGVMLDAYPVDFDRRTGSFGVVPSFRVFDFSNSAGNEIGVIWSDHDTGSRIVTARVDILLSSTTYFAEGTDVLTFANGTNIPEQFVTHSLDIVQLQEGNYSLVISGFPRSESLSMDYDLYYSYLYPNDTDSTSTSWLWNQTRFNRMDNSGISSYYPSIIQELHTNNLVVTYQETPKTPYGGLFATWSNNQGQSWHGPYDMSHPFGIDAPLLLEAIPTNSKESYRVVSKVGYENMQLFISKRPVLVPGRTSGFSMVYSAGALFTPGSGQVGICASQDVNLSQLKAHANCNPFAYYQWIVTATNPFSNFTWFELGEAKAISVGDTDRDGRHEILVASGKQAYLYEYESNTADNILHNQEWVSDPYEREITDIAISDANGNGFPEIVIESERGIVHTYEVINTLQGKADILYPKQESVFTTPDSGTELESIRTILVGDVDDDGGEDIVYSTNFGEVYALSGIDYSLIWKANLSNVYNNFFLNVTRDLQFVRDSTGSIVSVALIHLDTVALYDADTGTLQGSKSYGVIDISQMEVADIVPGGVQEIIIGTQDGFVFAYRGDSLDEIWNTDLSTTELSGIFFTGIRDIRAANYYSNSTLDVAVVGVAGNLTMYDGATGALIMQKEEFTITEGGGITPIDINNDNFTDIIFGDNITFAYDLANDVQLWNHTYEHYSQYYFDIIDATKDPIVTDINEDGNLDFVHANWKEYGLPGIIAYDGSTGDVLWTYQVEPPFNDATGVGIMQYHDLETSKNYTAIVYHVRNLNDELGLSSLVFLDARTGISLGGAPVPRGDAVAVGYLDFDRPVIISGGYNGQIVINSLWDGQPPVATPPYNELIDQPYFFLDDSFTRRTKYVLYEVTGDGVDDTFVIDDDYVGVGDTRRLLTDPDFNEVEWQDYNTSYGRFTGEYGFGDINKDTKQDLVVVFNNLIVVYDPVGGGKLFEFDFHNQYDWFGVPRNLHMIVDDVNSDGFDDILFSRDIIFNFLGYPWPITQVAWITTYNSTSGDTTLGHLGGNLFVPFVNRIKMDVADFDTTAAGNEIVLSMSFVFNPLVTIFAVGPADLSAFPVAFPLIGLPPINDIAVGDFDLNKPGAEMLLFFEFGLLDLPDLFLSLFGAPTLFINAGYEAGALTFGSHDLIGIAPTLEPTKRHWVVNNGTQDWVVIESFSGDRYQYQFNSSGGFMQPSQILRNDAVPYARSGFVEGNFKCGQFVAISAANGYNCYDELDFNSADVTAGATIDFGVIQDMVVGDLDDDGFDDLLIASWTGYVWVLLSTDQPLLQLSGVAEASFADRLIEFITSPVGFVVTTAIFGSVIAMPILRRRKIIKV